jgi:5-methyltetrahydrofolate--homocysteine methyltransferase
LNYIPAANANKPQDKPADPPAADDLGGHPVGCNCLAHMRLRRKARAG